MNEPTPINLQTAYRAWRQEKARMVKRTSMAAYVQRWHKLAPEFGALDVGAIDKRTVKDYVMRQLDAGLSVKTVRGHVMVLKLIMKFAADELGVQLQSTDWRLQYPPEHDAEGAGHGPARYSRDEVRQIMSWVTSNPAPAHLGIALALNTGMRIGEICALQWSDIDLEARTISVSRTLARLYNVEERETEIIIGAPKTTSSRRQIPITRPLHRLLKRFAGAVNADYYLLTSAKRWIEPAVYRRQVRRVMAECGISPVRKFHAFRHTFASLLIEGGCDVKTVSAILGHSDVSTTMNVYVHPSEKSKMEAVNRVMGRLW